MSESPYVARQKKLTAALEERRLYALALNPGPTLSYLTGLTFHLSERPVIFLFSADYSPFVVLPELEMGRLADVGFDLRIHSYDEDPSTWERAFRNLGAEARLDFKRVALEPGRMRILELRLLENVAPRSAYVSGDALIASLRAIKDAAEIASMRRAVSVAQVALKQTLPRLGEGITEKEAQSELVLQLLRAGSDGELPFAPIVAFGDHAANPHAVAGERKLTRGDLVLIDWGAAVNGYASDLTRMFCLGNPGEKLVRITEVVVRANQAAFDATAPNVSAGDVDRAARTLIGEAGFGPYFIHRTGHGLGLDVHEEPYIRSDNVSKLLAGMTFTIEPGIYLPNVGGARTEDDVIVTSEGAERLSDLPRNLVDLSD